MLMIVAVCAAALMPTAGSNDLLTAGHYTPVTSFPSPDDWLARGTTSFAVNVAANIVIAFMLLVINRTFRLMQSITWLFVGLFFFMQLAQPGVLTQFYSGSFLALTVLPLTALLFSTYTNPWLTRSTYLIFFLLALASLFLYNILFFLPVFILGMVQMKTADMRNILAVAMGCVTPLWILLGTGVLSVDSLRLPAAAVPDLATTATDHSTYILTLASTAFTGALGLILTFANFMKVVSYNSARRAFNGFITLLFVVTLILIAADHDNFTVYIPLLNALAAYQTGHFFATRRYRLSYIPYLIILLIYAAIASLPLLSL